MTPPLEQQLAKARLFDSRRTYAQSTNPKIVRVAGPNGFRWHVKRDGQTVSSHATQAEALAALKAGGR